MLPLLLLRGADEISQAYRRKEGAGSRLDFWLFAKGGIDWIDDLGPGSHLDFDFIVKK